MANGLTPPPPSEGRQRRNPRSGREDRSWGEAFMDPAGLEEFSKRRINPRLFAPRGGRRRNPGALYMEPGGKSQSNVGKTGAKRYGAPSELLATTNDTVIYDVTRLSASEPDQGPTGPGHFTPVVGSIACL